MATERAVKRDHMALSDSYASPWEMLAHFDDDYDTTTTTTTTTTTITTTTTTSIPNAAVVNSYADNMSSLTQSYNSSRAGSSNYSCDPNSDFMQALPWVRIIFGLLMVLENSLSLWALWHVKKMQHAIHRFITSLAVAELLMGVWCCYRYSAEILMGWEHSTVECRMRFVGITYLNFAAILSVCALCLDRCLALHFPFRYMELVTKSRVRMQLVLVWLLPFIVIITAYVNTGSSCENCTFVHIASQRTYIVLTVSRCLLIAVIIASELMLFRAARCQISKIYPNVFSSRSSARFVRMNAKAAVTTSAVVLPFLLLYTPVVVTQGRLAGNTGTPDECSSQLLAATWLFASAHGLFTPLVFCWRFREVRANLVRLLCRCALPEPERSMGIYHLRTKESAVTN